MDRNIIFIVLDTVRADVMREHASRIPQLADTVFQNLHAPSAATVPSHASFFTGELPHSHTVHSTDAGFGPIDFEDTIFADFDDYSRVAVSANAFVSPRYDAGKYFDTFDYITPYVRWANGLDPRRFYNSSDQKGMRLYKDYLISAFQHPYPFRSLGNAILSQSYQWLRQSPIRTPIDNGGESCLRTFTDNLTNVGGPVFGYLNLMDAHGPLNTHSGMDTETYNVPRDWASENIDFSDLQYSRGPPKGFDDFLGNYRTAYAGGVEYLDRLLAEYIPRIQESLPGETTFFITSDHGENLAYESDNYMFEHKSSLTEALLHVPGYVINSPPDWPETEKEIISLLDLGELLNGIKNGEYPEEVSGCPIASELIGSPVTDDSIVPPESHFWGRAIRCVIKEDEKFVWDSEGTSQLYEIGGYNDPSVQNQITENIEVPSWCHRSFNGEIVEVKKELDTDTGIAVKETNQETMKRLKELGYK